MSLLNVNAIEPSTGTDITLGASGDTTTVPSGATLDISASTLTPPATMPASSGVNLTALNASNLGSGTVPAARLSGVGKVLAYENTLTTGTSSNTTSTSFSSMQTDTITPSSSDSKILVIWSGWTYVDNNNAAVTSCGANLEVSRNHSGISDTPLYQIPFGQGFPENSGMDWQTYANQVIAFVDSPATTNEVTYSLNGKVDAATSILYIADGSTSRAFTLLELA